jgi:flavin reductase (DIM6/NTAB) family NADH-FMN oxidoreductase RutF
MADRMVACARALPPGESEVAHAHLSTRAAERVRPPILVDCPVALECRVLDIRKYGDNRVVVVEILLAHVRAGIADPVTWRVDYAHYAPVGRMNSPDGYVRTHDVFRKDFPRA